MKLPTKCIEGNLNKKYISKVSCGLSHTLFLTHAGMVFAVGNNTYGQLGQGDSFTQTESNEPLMVKGLIDYKIKDVFTGNNHNLIYGFVRDLSKHQVKDNIENKECFIFSWGDNKYGQLGLGEESKIVNTPTKITNISNENKSSLLCITGGVNSSYILYEDGKLFGFGDNSYNQITLKNEKNYYVPYLMSKDYEKNSMKIIDMLASANSVLLVSDDESVICFGKIFNNEIWTVKLICFDDDVKFSLTDDKLSFIYWNKNGEKKIIDTNNIKVISKEPPKVVAPQKETKSVKTQSQIKVPTISKNSSKQELKKFIETKPSLEKKVDAKTNIVENILKTRQSIPTSDSKSNTKEQNRVHTVENKLKSNASDSKINKFITETKKEPVKPQVQEPKVNKEPEKEPVKSLVQEPKVNKEPEKIISLPKKSEPTKEQQTIFKKIQPPQIEKKKIERTKTLEPQNKLDLSLSSKNLTRALTSSFSTQQSTPQKNELTDPDRNEDILNQSYNSETGRGLFEFKALFDFIPNKISEYRAKKVIKNLTKKETELQDLISNWTKKKKNIRSYRKYFIEGLPINFRSKLWLLCLKNTFSITKEYFEIELEKSKSNHIEKDIIYPFPSLGMFKPSSPMANDLIDIIRTFCSSRPDIGYNKNMCYLVGVLLLNLDKFQSYVSLMNIILNPIIIPFYFNSQQEIKNRLVIFKQIFYSNLPELCELFEMNDILPEKYFIDWNMTLFAKSFNVDLVTRIWDLYLIEGVKVIYSASIAILKFYQNEFMEMDEDEILELLTNSSEKKLEENEINTIINNIDEVMYPQWVVTEIKKIQSALSLFDS